MRRSQSCGSMWIAEVGLLSFDCQFGPWIRFKYRLTLFASLRCRLAFELIAFLRFNVFDRHAEFRGRLDLFGHAHRCLPAWQAVNDQLVALTQHGEILLTPQSPAGVQHERL